MAEHEQVAAQARATAGDDEIHVLDLAIVLARHRYLIIGCAVAGALVAMAISLVLTPKFTSTARVLPPQQQQNAGLAAMLGQLGGLAGIGGAAKTSTDLYVGILESRTVSDRLIERFKLKERYERQNMDDTRRSLGAVSDFSIGKKDGIIAVSVHDKEPAFAAQLANAYVEELANMTQNMALTEAAQRRIFFEKQLKEVKDQLADAEVALRTTQEKTGIVQPEAQVQAIIASVAQLKATVAAKEVQLASMRSYAAPGNPELQRAQQELSSLRAQLAQRENSRDVKSGDFMVPTGQIAAAGVEYVRSLRNVKYYETMFELLAKQYELARADEAKDGSLIQVLDKAIPAERRTSPKRALMTIAGGALGLVLGLLLTAVHGLYRASRNNPASAGRWQHLSLALRGRAPAPK